MRMQKQIDHETYFLGTSGYDRRLGVVSPLLDHPLTGKAIPIALAFALRACVRACARSCVGAMLPLWLGLAAKSFPMAARCFPLRFRSFPLCFGANQC